MAIAPQYKKLEEANHGLAEVAHRKHWLQGDPSPAALQELEALAEIEMELFVDRCDLLAEA